ncbi:MAG: ACT domain-containing protein, partial [Candidatus Nanohaloarchaea archaeon]
GYTVVQDGTVECDGRLIDDQVMITLKSPQDLEDTPGVLAYILSILAGREINITEFISCREDTHIVIHEDDATEAFSLLDEKLQA